MSIKNKHRVSLCPLSLLLFIHYGLILKRNLNNMCSLYRRSRLQVHTTHAPPSISPLPSFLHSLPPSFNLLKRRSPASMPPVHSSQCNFPTFQNEFEYNRCAHHATRESSTSSAVRRCSSLLRLYLGYPMSTAIITAKRIIWGKLYSASLPHSSSVSFSPCK